MVHKAIALRSLRPKKKIYKTSPPKYVTSNYLKDLFTIVSISTSNPSCKKLIIISPTAAQQTSCFLVFLILIQC